MTNYEVVREIFNHRPNSQMRDIFFLEVKSDDPESYVPRLLKGREISITTQTLPDGTVEIFATCDGINQRFLFTESRF